MDLLDLEMGDRDVSRIDSRSRQSIRRPETKIGAVPTELAGPEECSICYDAMTDAVETSCKHVFCRLCLLCALHTNAKCPMCRSSLCVRDIEEARSIGGKVRTCFSASNPLERPCVPLPFCCAQNPTAAKYLRTVHSWGSLDRSSGLKCRTFWRVGITVIQQPRVVHSQWLAREPQPTAAGAPEGPCDHPERNMDVPRGYARRPNR